MKEFTPRDMLAIFEIATNMLGGLQNRHSPLWNEEDSGLDWVERATDFLNVKVEHLDSTERLYDRPRAHAVTMKWLTSVDYRYTDSYFNMAADAIEVFLDIN